MRSFPFRAIPAAIGAVVLWMTVVAAATAFAQASPNDTDRAAIAAGVEAWERGDYQQAVAAWQPVAARGDPDAQFNMGQAHKLGRGVPVDLSQAETWYRHAVSQSHIRAGDNLGLLLFATNRREEAIPYIERAAIRGEPRAQYVYGTMLYNGTLVSRDLPRAYAFVKRASDSGFSIATTRLARLDQLLSPSQRQQGLALMGEMERDEQRTQLTATTMTVETPGTISPAVPRRETPAPPLYGEPVLSDRGSTGAVVPSQPAQPAQSFVSPPAHPAASEQDLWRIQLGAFSSYENANSLKESLTRKNPALSAKSFYLVTKEGFTRLQLGNFAYEYEARSFCANMKSNAQPCIVIKK